MFLWFKNASERGWYDGVHMRRVHELTMQPVLTGVSLAKLAAEYDYDDWINHFFRNNRNSPLYLEGFISGYLTSESFPKE